MSEKLFVELNGKAIIVHTFWIEHYDGALVAKMKCVDESQKSYFIVFENISRLNMSGISYPFQICGFEIVDHHSRGYQNDSRFFVNDYEGGTLSFYCEKIEILESV